MHKLLSVLALVAGLGTAVGCGILGGGYSPDQPVKISVTASPKLNEYEGSPHALDVYVYKLDDPSMFQATKIGQLTVEAQPVAGGFALQRRSVKFGEKFDWPIGAMQNAKYKYLGVVAAYKDAKGQIRMTARIPSDGHLKLVLDPKGIESFGPAQ